MKSRYISLAISGLLVVLTTAVQGQQISSKRSAYEATTYVRLGTQQLDVNGLNQVLQQTGYGTLATQVPVLSIASQMSRPGRALSFYVEVGGTLGPGMRATNGIYNVQTHLLSAELGAAYRLVNAGKFQLSPKLAVVSLPYYIEVKQLNNPAPSLTSILTDPGNAKSTRLEAGTLGLDAGLLANMRFPYGSPRQYDCYSMERSIVIGLDAGYRLAARTPFDNTREINPSNPSVQLGGWYAGIHIGFGRLVRKTGTATVN